MIRKAKRSLKINLTLKTCELFRKINLKKQRHIFNNKIVIVKLNIRLLLYSQPSIAIAIWKEDDVLNIHIDSVENIKTNKLYVKTYLLPHKRPKRKPKKMLSRKDNRFNISINVSSYKLPTAVVNNFHMN